MHLIGRIAADYQPVRKHQGSKCQVGDVRYSCFRAPANCSSRPWSDLLCRTEILLFPSVHESQRRAA